MKLLLSLAPLLTLTAAKYSEDAAKRYVDLAGAAYCTPEQIETGNNQHQDLVSDFTPYKVWSSPNLQFYTGYDSSLSSVFVSVRGSLDIDNWIDNIDAFKTAPYEDKSIEVHDGFYSEYKKMRDDIVSFIEDASEHFGGIKKLSISSHSSGAANSVLLTYDIARGDILPGYSLTPMYTYGCPRVGNPAFYDSYNAFDIEHYRVVHNKDIVPHLPLEVMGFHHTNQEIWYSTEDSSTFIECDDSGEDGNCSNSLTFAMSSSDHCEYVGKPICACADTFEEVLEKIGGEVVEKVGGFLRGTVIVD